MEDKIYTQTPESARAAADSSAALKKLSMLFDPMTFVQTGTFVKRNRFAGNASVAAEELEGVVTGYGSVDGMLVYAFAQDASRLHGAIDENHAKKIEALYHLALSNGAPVVGVFDCAGASLSEGVSSMAAYGKMLACFSEASGAIPQIAIIDGPCTGTLAAAAAMFDFAVKTDNGSLYVTSPALNGAKGAAQTAISFEGDAASAFGYVRALLGYLPAVCDGEVDAPALSDDPNRMMADADLAGGAKYLLSKVCDNGAFLEVDGSVGAAVTAFGFLGGIRCGLVATNASENEGKLSAMDARKLSKFIAFCDAFSMPVVSFVNSAGVVTDAENEPFFACELAKLAQTSTEADIPMISILYGKTLGASYILLGSKAVGADLVYALENTEVGALDAKTAVALTESDKITLSTTREDLEREYAQNQGSALAAATYGEVDDLITASELRARICSALYMMRGEGPEAKRRSGNAL